MDGDTMQMQFSDSVLAKAHDCTATHLHGALWGVESPSGGRYKVHTDGITAVCDCPTYQPTCSHVAAVLLAIRGTTDTPRPSLAQRDRRQPDDCFAGVSA